MQVHDLRVDIPLEIFFVKCEDNAIWNQNAFENRAHHVTKDVALGWGVTSELPPRALKW